MTLLKNDLATKTWLRPEFSVQYFILIPLSPANENFDKKYFAMCKVYTDEDGIKYLYHGLSTCTEDNPLAHLKACGLSPRTGGQTMV